jgi:predicted ester cyclase
MSDAGPLLRRWFTEVWNERRDATIDELMSPDAAIQGLAPAAIRGDGFREVRREFLRGFPDLHIEVDDVVAQLDMAAVRFSCTGTHTGVFQGIPPTNAKVSFKGTVFARVESGRVVEAWNLVDQLTLLTQLGVVQMPSPPL